MVHEEGIDSLRPDESVVTKAFSLRQHLLLLIVHDAEDQESQDEE